MSKENLKQALIAVCVAALSAFVSSFAQGLVELIKQNAVEVASGTLSATIYLAKAYKG